MNRELKHDYVGNVNFPGMGKVSKIYRDTPIYYDFDNGLVSDTWEHLAVDGVEWGVIIYVIERPINNILIIVEVAVADSEKKEASMTKKEKNWRDYAKSMNLPINPTSPDDEAIYAAYSNGWDDRIHSEVKDEFDKSKKA